MGIDDTSVKHMANWFECIRSRQQPIATVHDGFGHSVACIMAAESYWTARTLLGYSKGRDFGPRATGDVKLKVVALHLVHQVIA